MTVANVQYDHPRATVSSPPVTERLRIDDLSETDRTFAVAIHLSPLSYYVLGPLGFFVPLILWLVRKDESPFNDDHGRELINFSISFILLHIILAITIIGLLLWPVLWIVALVSIIRGAIAGGRGEYFRYPVTIRFLS